MGFEASARMKVELSSIHLLSIAYFALLLPKICNGSNQYIKKLSPPLAGAPMNWVDKEGLFLLSENNKFAFGFQRLSSDVTKFFLVVIHMKSSIIIWTANRGLPVANADKFNFSTDGNAMLQSGDSTIWSTNTSGKGAAIFELQDSGNLVLLSNASSSILWQTFNNPTDTLLSGQNFTKGMKLMSNPSSNGLIYHLEMEAGDVMFYADFKPPQPYWSMQKDDNIITNDNGGVVSVSLDSNSWKAYGGRDNFLWQYLVSNPSASNSTLAAVLGSNGLLSFFSLDDGSNDPLKTIPEDRCQTPEPCEPYNICSSNTQCQCPTVLSSNSNCKPRLDSLCDSKGGNDQLVRLDEGLGYFAIGFVPPAATKYDLINCKDMCMANCSCRALFFEDKSGNCYLFSDVGSLQQSGRNSTSYISFVKFPRNESGSNPRDDDDGGGSKKHIPMVIVIAVVTVLVIAGLVYFGFFLLRRKPSPEPSDGSTEEENFLEELSGMPIRFTYKELETATKNFTMKLGQGGFGSVYHGVLPDGSQIAVKKLEGIGQGKKEFRAEVSIIGSIHHVHLVRLRGFCAEGTHRLLAYEYMANGSLERWIFRHNNKEGIMLDWDKRFNIALATAKGLAYLHEDCSVKIVHCDIKPENVLLDENFVAKVSDFGLAKLMTREQSHVFTTLRGTRGYLAPEWITNYAISEKSDVYSFGMVLLEIIGGRKNYDPSEVSEKAHFPSYAFKKMEEGKLKDIFDAKLKYEEKDGRISIAIKVALWCVQEDMHLRPSMVKVVQMLEGLSEVLEPPISSHLGSRIYSSFLKSVSEGTSSGPSDFNSDAFLSAVRLSGPR